MMLLSVILLCLQGAAPSADAESAPQGSPAQETPSESPLARRAVDLARAAQDSHAGWERKTLPPLYDMGLAAFRSGDQGRAIEVLLVLLDGEPDFPPATLMLGSVYFKLRRHDDAVEMFQRFLAHAPGELKRTRHLGHSLYSLGRYEEALGHYDRVLGQSAEDGGLRGKARARALRGRGLSQMHLGFVKEARRSLLLAAGLDPRDGEAQLALARVHEENEDLEEAAGAASRAQELMPFDPRCAFLLGTLMSDLGKPEEAGRQRERFERLSPVDILIRDLETRLLHAPDDRSALAGLVRHHATIGNVAGLRGALQRLTPENVDELLLVLETCVTRLPSAAAAAGERLRKAFPSDPRGWRALATYYEALGDTARSVEAAARASDLEASAR